MFLNDTSLVLACEGTEMKSYMRKQASGKHILKHMHNGGRNSFTFHSSPRMIPHIFKPEVQYVQMEIEQYVPRGKKVIDGSDIRTPAFTKQLTATESAVVAKYFQYANWRPSLITFPSVQTYPSRVHQVMHSSRTEMLIDAMQNLQALSFPPVDNRGFSVEVQCFCFTLNYVAVCSFILSMQADTFAEKGEDIENVDYEDHDKEDFGWGYDSPENNQSDYDEPMEHEVATKSPSVLDLTGKSHTTHSFLFSSDFVSVDSLGKVLISYVPSLPLKVASHNGAASVNCEKGSPRLKTCNDDSTRSATVENFGSKLTTSPETRCLGDSYIETGINAHSPKVDENCNDYEDAELSPRLTNMLRSELLNDMEMEEILVPQDVTRPSPWRTESNAPNIVLDADMACPVISDRIQNHLPETTDAKVGQVVSSISPVLKESDSPSTNVSSREWLVSSSDKSESIQPARRLKRLRKVGEIAEQKNSGSTRDGSTTYRNQTKHGRGKREQLGIINDFIEEEAEASPNGEASGDEIIEEDDDSYEPCFIDDRMNPTQPSKVDMMAVYRRSLLSQSPMPRESPLTAAAITTPDCDSSISCKNNSGSSSERNRSSPAIPCSTSYLPTENSAKSDIRKRKLSSFHGPGAESVPIVNLEKEFAAEATNNKNAADVDVDVDIDDDMLYDDKFFATLDALEAEASSVMQQKNNNRSDSSSLQKLDILPPPPSVLDDSELDGLPTFDLGF
ncbi:DEAD-box ATP-dependent RNA helicase FANCM [Linum grandiflorum]